MPSGLSGTASSNPATVTLNASEWSIRNKGSVAILISWNGGTDSYPTSIDPGMSFTWRRTTTGTITIKTGSGTAAYEIVYDQ